MPKLNKRGISLICILLVLATLLCGCAPAISQITDTTAPDPSQEPSTSVPDPDPSYTSDKYHIISKEEYYDKTTAGFLSQLVGFLSGHEYSKSSDGKCAVAMPDSKFRYLDGLYASNAKADKHSKNISSGLWEVWFDDDFSVDIVNQYILGDMYRQKGTVCQKYITAGWISYDVWDMGGGQRQAGAYGAIKRNNYLPQFSGNTEYENWYSFLSEAYIATDTLGMSAAGMPETAAYHAGVFAQTTGDRDNVLWAQMFSTMISLAYFEDDIPTLIKKSSDAVFPKGSWPCLVLEDVFAVYEKYPDDWRKAYIEFEAKHYVKDDTKDADTDINCAFVILDLLYGGGDYMTTCKIGSLAGYDCETTCGIALTVLGVMNGTSILPEKTNELIWQDGEGVLVNLVTPAQKNDEGIWMIAAGLPDRIKITKVLEKFRKNFESILLDNGGAIDDYYYYIPIEKQYAYKTVTIENGDFEKGDLSGYTKTGTVTISDLATTGFYSAKLSDNATLTTKVSGLEAGKIYSLSAYIRTTENATALLFAQDKGGANAVCASVHKTVGTPKYEAQSTVKRTLTFTATASEMEIGVKFIGTGTEYSIVDTLTLYNTQETSVGTVTITNKSANNTYSQATEFVANCEKKTEVYLKLRFENGNSKHTNFSVMVNGEKYASGAFYKTYKATDMENSNYVYIPVVVKEGENSIFITPQSTVCIYDPEIVLIQNRF